MIDARRVTVLEDPSFQHGSYASVPMAFETRVVMRAPRGPAGELVLLRHAIAAPFAKDYDALAEEAPASWANRFDLSRWQFFGAWDDDIRIGSAAMVMRSPEIDMLEGRDDLAVLWDIRVAPAAQRSGAGTALLGAVERAARDHGARSLKVETQDVNAPACLFYERQGFQLQAANPGAYPELPGETQLIWHKKLEGTGIG